jgi:hypothetical protein
MFKIFKNIISFSESERIRLDCASGASHNLNRLLYKPGSGSRV